MREFEVAHLRALYNRLIFSKSPASDFLEIRKKMKGQPVRLLTGDLDQSEAGVIMEAFRRTLAGCERLQKSVFSGINDSPFVRRTVQEEIEFLSDVVREKNLWHQEVVKKAAPQEFSYLKLMAMTLWRAEKGPLPPPKALPWNGAEPLPKAEP